MEPEQEFNPDTTPVEDLFLLSVQTDDPQTKRSLRQTIAARDTDSCYGLFSLAWLMADNKTGEAERIISLYSEALNLNPGFWLARFERANTYFDNDQLAPALQDYEETIREGVDEPNLHYNAALIKAKQGKYADARKYYDTTIELDPEHGPAYFGRAAIFIHDRKYKDASSDLAKAVECEPENPVYRTTHGLTYINLSEFENAMRELDKAVALSPKDPKLYNFRANLCIIMGNYAPALRDAAAILVLDPADWHAYEMLGGLLMAQKKNAEALWTLKKSLELNPDNARVKTLLAEKKFEKLAPSEPDLKAMSEL